MQMYFVKLESQVQVRPEQTFDTDQFEKIDFITLKATTTLPAESAKTKPNRTKDPRATYNFATIMLLQLSTICFSNNSASVVFDEHLLIIFRP